MSPQPVNASRADIIAMLRDGHSNARIVRELRVDKHRVRCIREELGLPNFVPVEQTRTIEDKWNLFARPVDGGHMEWTGERQSTSGTPVMRYKDGNYTAAAVAFRIQHGRAPEGYVLAECGHKHCVAPAHVLDEKGRLAKRQELRRAAGRSDRPDTCDYGHDQNEHGRLHGDGRAYCAACKREWHSGPDGKRAARAAAREAVQREIETRLRKNIPQNHIARQLGVSPATVQRTREALGLPTPRCGPRERYGSLEEAFRDNTVQVDGGHLRGNPYVCFRQDRIAASRVAFELHYARPPVGRALPTCGVSGCLAGEHLADRQMREANRRADKAFAAIFGADT